MSVISNILQRCRVCTTDYRQNTLSRLLKRSAKAVDVVTSAIKGLDDANAEIDVELNEILVYRKGLDDAEAQLTQVKDRNAKISSRFKSLIEA